MEHRWTTGTYAGLKGTVSTSESGPAVNADRTNYVPGTAVTDEDGNELISTAGKAHLAAGGTLFAVIMRRLTTSARAFHPTTMNGASSPAAPCPAGGYMSAGPVRRAIVRP